MQVPGTSARTATDVREGWFAWREDFVQHLLNHRTHLFAQGRRQPLITVCQLLVGLALIGLWEFASTHWIDPYWISRPLRVTERLITSLTSGMILPHLYITLEETVVGYVIGGLLGIALGFSLARLTVVAKILDPYIMAFNGIPRIALAPLMIIWFGIGLPSKIVQAVLMVFFITFFNTYSGAQTVDPDLIRMMRVLGANHRQLLTKIVIPSTMPWTIAALRMSVPYALVGAVVGEFIAASQGLGYLIQLNSAYFDTTGALANVLLLALIVLIANGVACRIERRLLVWRLENELTVGDAL